MRDLISREMMTRSQRSKLFKRIENMATSTTQFFETSWSTEHGSICMQHFANPSRSEIRLHFGRSQICKNGRHRPSLSVSVCLSLSLSIQCVCLLSTL